MVLGDEMAVADVPGADVHAAGERRRQALEKAPGAARVVAGQGSDMGALSRQFLGEVAADKSAGSSH